MSDRLYPIDREVFETMIEGRISEQYKRIGRPAGI